MSREIKIAVVGAGVWGQNLIRVFSEMGVLAGVCDPDRERVEQSINQVKKLDNSERIRVMEWQELLDSRDINAVVLAVPVSFHYRMAMEALSEDKHVWLEKPMVLSVEEGEEIVRAMNERGRVVMVDHLMRYHLGIEKMLSMIHGGVIGKLWRVETYRRGFGRIFRDADALYDLMPHDLSVVMAMMEGRSRVIDVSGIGGSFSGNRDLDWAEGRLTYDNNTCVSISISRLYPIKEQRIVVTGEKGAILFDDRRERDKSLLYINHRIISSNGITEIFEGDEEEYIGVGIGEPLRRACEHFVDCVVGRAECRTSAIEALQGLRLLDKIVKTIYRQIEVDRTKFL